MMQKFCVLLFFWSLSYSGFSQNGKASPEVCYNPNAVNDTTKKSIKSAAIGIIGNDTVKINYHSPGVRSRIIWGGLVPFGEVWVTGAHNATHIELQRSCNIGGRVILPGKYALFTIPGKKEWIVILNRQWDQHLANDYDESLDVVRFKVKPLKNKHTERLQYFITPVHRSAGKIAVAWEKIKIEFPILFL